MTVLVDNAYIPYGRMIMCHMIADNHYELVKFAHHIGLNTKWLQKEGTPHEHFDVSKMMRERAVLNGAKEVTVRELGTILRMRFPNGFTL